MPTKASIEIPSIVGMESLKVVESDSPESSRASKVRSIGMQIFDEEGKSIAAKETDIIELFFFHVAFLTIKRGPIAILSPKFNENTCV